MKLTHREAGIRPHLAASSETRNSCGDPVLRQNEQTERGRAATLWRTHKSDKNPTKHGVFGNGTRASKKEKWPPIFKRLAG